MSYVGLKASMKDITTGKGLIITTTSTFYTIENVDVGGDLVVSGECINLRELTLTGTVHVKGDIVCRVPEGCNLVIISDDYKVGGCVRGFNTNEETP